MRISLLTAVAFASALGVGMIGPARPAAADQTISAMIPVLGRPQQPRTVLTAQVSTVVHAQVDCERFCLHVGYNNPPVICGGRGMPSIVGTTLGPGSYYLSIRRGHADGICTGVVRVTP